MDGVFVMVIAIVAISTTAGVVNNYLKTRRLALEAGPGDEVRAELDALRKRVAVLEEIVTDNRYHLSQELDRLERQA
ncbi:MAG: hypothetical protein R3E86_16865 [Pseudomonadales bacterium]